MLIPIGDENPCERRPYATWSLMGLLVVAGLVMALRSGSLLWALAPGSVPWWLGPCVPQGAVDLGWSLLFLWIFADNVEDRFGPIGLLVGYVLAGWMGQAVHLLAGETVEAWHGPSYGVTGVVAAYVTMFPRHEVRILNLFPLLLSSRLHGLYGDGNRPEIPTHYIHAWWMAVLWPLLILVCDGLNAVGVSSSGMIGAGAFGAVGAWGLVRLWRIRIAAPTVHSVVELNRVRGRASAGTVASPDLVVPKGPTRSAPSARPQPPAAGSSFLEVESAVEEVVEGAEVVEGTPVDHSGQRGFAVIRVTEELADVSELGRKVALRTEEYLGDVTRRIRATRGILVREATREVAEGVLDDLRSIGLDSALVDLGITPYFPEPRGIAGAGCSSEGCEFELRDGERVTVPWRRISLIAAGQIEKRRTVQIMPTTSSGAPMQEGSETVERLCIDSLIDFVVTIPRTRYRLYRQDANFRLMMEAEGATGELGFKRFVKALLVHRGKTPVNTGLKVLDGGGRWGYLRFRSERDFDDYCWWLDRLLSWRAAQQKSTSFLE